MRSGPEAMGQGFRWRSVQKNCSRQGESGVRRRRKCRTGQFKGKVKDFERDAVMMKGAGGGAQPVTIERS